MGFGDRWMRRDGAAGEGEDAHQRRWSNGIGSVRQREDGWWRLGGLQQAVDRPCLGDDDENGPVGACLSSEAGLVDRTEIIVCREMLAHRADGFAAHVPSCLRGFSPWTRSCSKVLVHHYILVFVSA